jgi:hypothetical protein
MISDNKVRGLLCFLFYACALLHLLLGGRGGKGEEEGLLVTMNFFLGETSTQPRL